MLLVVSRLNVQLSLLQYFFIHEKYTKKQSQLQISSIQESVNCKTLSNEMWLLICCEGLPDLGILCCCNVLDLGSDPKLSTLMVQSIGFGLKPTTAMGFGTNYLAFSRFSFLVAK